MIVELFGPSGVGKTTLSHALAAVMRSRGYCVELVSSARPTEQPDVDRSDLARVGAHAKRAAKALGAVAALFLSSHEAAVEAELMSLLKGQSLWIRIRNGRYLLWLRKLWAQARSSEGIVIFDQGYLSALCSIACQGSVRRSVMCGVLDRLPKADILVCLDATQTVIEERLRARLDRMGPIARRLELDISTTLRQVEIAADLRDQVGRNKKPALVCCLSLGSPLRLAQAIVDEIETLPAAQALLPRKQVSHRPSLSLDHHAFRDLHLVTDR